VAKDFTSKTKTNVAVKNLPNGADFHFFLKNKHPVDDDMERIDWIGNGYQYSLYITDFEAHFIGFRLSRPKRLFIIVSNKSPRTPKPSFVDWYEVFVRNFSIVV
jgi:hypothetical protein